MRAPTESLYLKECFEMPVGALKAVWSDESTPDRGAVWSPSDQPGGVRFRVHRDPEDRPHALTVFVRFADQPHTQTLRLARTDSSVGGERVYWIGPTCEQRREKLFWDPTAEAFRCRECASAAYECNQRSNSREYECIDRWAHKARRVAQRLDLDPDDGLFSWPEVPEKPAGMHETTYRTLLAEFQTYRQRALQGLADYLATEDPEPTDP